MEQKILIGAHSWLMSNFQNKLEVLKNHQHSILKELSLLVLLLLIPLGMSAQGRLPECIVEIVSELPDEVQVTVTAKPGIDSYFTISINDTSLAGTGIPAWCADLDKSLGVEGPLSFKVFSSYETLPGNNFRFPQNFDLVNWVLNQDFIGTTSPSGGVYTFGHIQEAIWFLVDRYGCSGNGCASLTDPVGQWDNSNDLLKAREIEQAAKDNGEGFVPQCGELFGIVLIPFDENNEVTKQSLIITKSKRVPPLVECGECEGKVTELELQYNGTAAADIVVKTKKKGESSDTKVVFDLPVGAGGTFSFVGNDEKGTLGTEITIYVNGVENTKIHTSCSQPIGPGLIIGDLEVISGSSRNGGELCPIDTPPNGDDCGECDGKVTALKLQNNGDSAYIVVKTKKKGETSGTKVVFV